MARRSAKRKTCAGDIGLAPGLPLELKLKGGLGETDIDLSQLLVPALKLESGMGALRLTLPQQEQPLSADIAGGLGTMAITFPDDAAGEFKVRGGVGNVALQAPQALALRLQFMRGLGKIDLPEGKMRATEQARAAGKQIWESLNSGDAGPRIFIDYQGGVGRFSLRPSGPASRRARDALNWIDGRASWTPDRRSRWPLPAGPSGRAFS